MQTSLQNEKYTIKHGATFCLTGLSGSGKSTIIEGMKNHLEIMLDDSKKVKIISDKSMTR